jgi:hypothetical protein
MRESWGTYTELAASLHWTWFGQGDLWAIVLAGGDGRRLLPEQARWLFDRDCPWSTFVFASSVGTLVEAGVECVPVLHNRLIRLGLYLGTRREAWALRQVYELAPTADFSRDVLQSCPASLAVSPILDLTWCDLGKPARVARSLEKLQALWPPGIQRDA